MQTQSPRKAPRRGITFSGRGFPRTMAFEMPVNSVMNGGIQMPGSINSEKVETTAPSTAMTAATSMMRSAPALRPVVSKSKTAIVFIADRRRWCRRNDSAGAA